MPLWSRHSRRMSAGLSSTRAWNSRTQPFVLGHAALDTDLDERFARQRIAVERRSARRSRGGRCRNTWMSPARRPSRKRGPRSWCCRGARPTRPPPQAGRTGSPVGGRRDSRYAKAWAQATCYPGRLRGRGARGRRTGRRRVPPARALSGRFPLPTGDDPTRSAGGPPGRFRAWRAHYPPAGGRAESERGGRRSPWAHSPTRPARGRWPRLLRSLAQAS